MCEYEEEMLDKITDEYGIDFKKEKAELKKLKKEEVWALNLKFIWCIAIVVMLLACCLLGCEYVNNPTVVEMPHPHRDLGEIPIIHWFDWALSFTSNIKWLDDGFICKWTSEKNWDYSNPDFHGMGPATFYESYVPKNKKIGDMKLEDGFWVVHTGRCLSCKLLVPFPNEFKKCPSCGFGVGND